MHTCIIYVIRKILPTASPLTALSQTEKGTRLRLNVTIDSIIPFKLFLCRFSTWSYANQLTNTQKSCTGWHGMKYFPVIRQHTTVSRFLSWKKMHLCQYHLQCTTVAKLWFVAVSLLMRIIKRPFKSGIAIKFVERNFQVEHKIYHLTQDTKLHSSSKSKVFFIFFPWQVIRNGNCTRQIALTSATYLHTFIF